MRYRNAIVIGVFAVGAVVSTGIAGQAEEVQPAGQPGTYKPTTFDGYQIINLPSANVPNFARRIAVCPPGKRVVGGGGEARGNGAILVGTFPTDDGRGWIVLGRQIGFNDVGISVYAICAVVT